VVGKKTKPTPILKQSHFVSLLISQVSDNLSQKSLPRIFVTPVLFNFELKVGIFTKAGTGVALYNRQKALEIKKYVSGHTKN